MKKLKITRTQEGTFESARFEDGTLLSVTPKSPAAQELGAKGGKSTSEAKKKASRLNGKKGGKPKRFIVKVQVPLFSSEYTTSNLIYALIYNEDRSIFTEMPIGKKILKIMEGAPKSFFFAIMKETTLELQGEAPWQDW